MCGGSMCSGRCGGLSARSDTPAWVSFFACPSAAERAVAIATRLPVTSRYENVLMACPPKKCHSYCRNDFGKCKRPPRTLDPLIDNFLEGAVASYNERGCPVSSPCAVEGRLA